MNAATITLIVIVVALLWVVVQSRSKDQPKLVVALKPTVGASILAPRGSATLLEDSINPKSGESNAAAMVASSSVAFDLA
jgi:hypothetical protein